MIMSISKIMDSGTLGMTPKTADLFPKHQICTSAMALCKGRHLDTRQMMVYGFAHTEYTKVIEILNRHGLYIFNSDIGDFLIKSACKENSFIKKMLFDSDDSRYVKRKCKMGIVNFHLFNYQRFIDKKPLIPSILVLDCDNNRYPLNVEKIVEDRSFITHSEVIVFSKVPEISDDPKWKEACTRSVICVKVKYGKPDFYRRSDFLEEISAPWKDPKWKVAIEKRKARKLLKQKENFSTKTYSWKDYLAAEKTKIDEAAAERMHKFSRWLTLRS